MRKVIDEVKLYEEAVTALSAFVAASIVRNARENDDDPLTYSTDEEIVELYAKQLARDVSKRLPSAVEYIAKVTK